MPKNNKVVKHDGRLFKHKVPATLRVGTRKTGVSGHRMSTDALLAVLGNKDKSKSHSNAAAVLRLRGVAFEWPRKLAA